MLGLANSEGARGTGSAKEVSEVGNGAVTAGAVDTGTWGSTVCTVGGG